ncbi:hypothetical protein B0A52_05618 [Exophiala mesophila]|uniref:Protein kinase domain-containing protein n=1 Tax=Exophiala mesophila TaxID=212818 RepID=A0A0D1ZFD8_EXOME|nr:uncharacterized protein PV10_03853 [Exophiala mesophila]KIV92569.1 hypothetical protein PV10_03853 [Exophiala mesophila]RVX70285.1 hypothetical protein B0A52_05618 [Exophiala mesophila]
MDSDRTSVNALFSEDLLEFLASGKSSVAYGIDDERVLKDFHDRELIDVERRVYIRLGLHPNIPKYLGSVGDGILLERGQVLRKILQQQGADLISVERKVQWLTQAAQGLQYIHDNNIIHADVGCHNMILTRQGELKIIDFEGSSIDGGPADSYYEWFSYRRPPSEPSVGTDIFAFGCAVYETITGRPPYHELESSEDSRKLIHDRYDAGIFPDVASLPLGALMQKCWHNDFTSMNEVVQEIRVFGQLSLPEQIRSLIVRAAAMFTSSCISLNNRKRPNLP